MPEAVTAEHEHCARRELPAMEHGIDNAAGSDALEQHASLRIDQGLLIGHSSLIHFPLHVCLVFRELVNIVRKQIYAGIAHVQNIVFAADDQQRHARRS